MKLDNVHVAESATGIIEPSPDYLAPEQACSEPVTHQTDICSLDMVLYETPTGEHPFPNATTVELMYKHLNEPLPLITALPSDVVDGVNAIV